MRPIRPWRSGPRRTPRPAAAAEQVPVESDRPHALQPPARAWVEALARDRFCLCWNAVEQRLEGYRIYLEQPGGPPRLLGWTTGCRYEVTLQEAPGVYRLWVASFRSEEEARSRPLAVRLAPPPEEPLDEVTAIDDLLRRNSARLGPGGLFLGD